MFKVILIFLCLAPMSAFAQAVIFSDDFTNPLASHQKWSPSLVSGISDGTVTITNNHSTATELRTATLNPKPSTFTLSFIVKSTLNNNGGVFFCKQEGVGNFDGYAITTFSDMVVVFRHIGGTGTSVFNERSFDLKPEGNNKITVSKSGTKFNIFVNDMYLGTFNDSQYASGDISLFVRPNTSITFGAITVTDEFIEENHRTSFRSKFDSPDGSGLRYWNIHGESEIEEGNGVLYVKTGNAESFLGFVDLKLGDEFSAKVETGFVQGDLTHNNTYGIVLVGERGESTRMVYFAISGAGHYYISSGGSVAVKNSNKIWGHLQNDTLEVRKQAGSSVYEFYANGSLLDFFPVVDFKIASIGLFANRNLLIYFDDFFAGKEGTTSISNIPAKRSVSTASFAGIKNGQINLRLQAGNYTAELYNLQGRLISSVEINAINGVNATGLRTTNLSKGVFILNVKQAGNSVLRNKVLVK